LIDDDDVLRSGGVGVGEGAAGEDGDLEGIEEAGGDVDFFGAGFLAGVGAVVEGDLVVEGAFVGEGEADGGVLDAGDLAHGGRAGGEESVEGGGVVVAGFVEGSLGGEDAVRVESGGQVSR